MNTSIITVENLSKLYRIGMKEQGHKTFREAIVDSLMMPLNNLKRLNQLTDFKDENDEDFHEDILWALKNISFDVKEGEVLGIIGRNGAGKSTLLKILSRITEPTKGDIHIYGRVSSLLEVGTGFHPELTGRENIFLNGAILGMRKWEIKKNFDAIVAFAEIEKFLDTPVKRYSSGMYVRLAFAVAAHLEPEILIVDEVLAVGDVDFQKKCLGKMGEVAKGGRTVLFVSHNMPMVSSLCDKCILLEKGSVSQYGQTKQVIDFYYSHSGASHGEMDFTKTKKCPGDDKAKLLKVRIVNSQNEKISEANIGEPFVLEMEYQLLEDNLSVNPNFHVYTAEGAFAFAVSDAPLDPLGELKSKKGTYISRCHIPENFLNDGAYYIGFALSEMSKSYVHFFERDTLMINIVDPIEGTLTRGKYVGSIPGMIRPLLKWESRRIE